MQSPIYHLFTKKKCNSIHPPWSSVYLPPVIRLSQGSCSRSTGFEIPTLLLLCAVLPGWAMLKCMKCDLIKMLFALTVALSEQAFEGVHPSWSKQIDAVI